MDCCERGLLCERDRETSVCLLRCDPVDGNCPEDRSTCIDGTCRSDDRCDLMGCAERETRAIALHPVPRTVCVPAGEAPLGAPCDDAARCDTTGTCFAGICRAHCDAERPCADGTCAPLSNLGRPALCVQVCDPSDAAACAEGTVCRGTVSRAVRGSVPAVLWVCAPGQAGPLGHGDACVPAQTPEGNCRAGHACVAEANPLCRQLCDDAHLACPDASACAASAPSQPPACVGECRPGEEGGCAPEAGCRLSAVAVEEDGALVAVGTCVSNEDAGQPLNAPCQRIGDDLLSDCATGLACAFSAHTLGCVQLCAVGAGSCPPNAQCVPAFGDMGFCDQ